MKNNNTAPTIATRNNKQLDRLKTLLKELFQLDKPELDFGLYKIMHAKSAQISQFLDNDLLKEIEAAFGAESEGRVQQAEQKVAEALEQAKTFGAPDPEATQGVAQARAAYKLALEGGNTEAEIYDHLYRFFERYYDNGDFLSKRYYARENDSRAAPYSVPYDGREVYLHWANKDQYYIKSGEYLNNFSFDLTEAARLHREAKVQPAQGLDFGDATSEGQPLKVHMHLAQAQEGEHGNIKAASNQKREFIPLLSRPVEFNDHGELVLNFEYKVLPDGYPIDAEASAALMSQYDFKNKGDVPAHWMADLFLQTLQATPKADPRYLALLAEAAPTETQKGRPLLAKYIQQYTARNTMDYFIHKDLGGFLKRELDFYVKNELMRLDDIESAEAPRVEQYLGKIKALRRIAHQLIDFLAQLEDFQKKLWLKKKFITEVNYCITLDRIPERFYSEIAASNAQHDEWVKLFEIDNVQSDVATVGYSKPLSFDFLKYNPMLPVDTALLAVDLKEKIIAGIEDIDRNLDGILINSDNFHGLRLLNPKLTRKIRSCYIDPPFNLGETSDYLYKVDYKDSTWLAFLQSRLVISKELLKIDGSQFVRCNHDGNMLLRLMLNEVFRSNNYRNEIIVRRAEESKGDLNKQFAGVKSITVNYDNIYWYSQNPHVRYDRFMKPTKEGQSKAHWHSFWKAENRPNLRYVIMDIDLRNHYGQWMWKTERAFRAVKNYQDYLSAAKNGISLESYWLEKKEGYKEKTGFDLEFVYRFGDGYSSIKYWIPPRDFVMADNNWLDLKGYANTWSFKTENSEVLLKRVVSTVARPGEYFLDYFAGSGTSAATSHKLKRKWITMEQGDHFDSVVKDRLSKVLYGEKSGISAEVEWNGGGLFKYVRLESYEDTLNNLSLQADPARERALANNPALRQDYVLNYWLDVETQGSQSLLNVANFRDPTAYTMRIKQPGSDVQRMQRIDLIETFNWLIGLWVEHLAAPQTLTAEFKREVDPLLPKDQNTRLVCSRIKRVASSAAVNADASGTYWFRLVEGYTLKVPGDDSSRQKTLVVWRKLTDDQEKDNAVLQHFLMEKLAISPREQTYAVIYVNGSHTLPNPVVEGEQTKVRLIEEAFHNAMWSQDGA